MIRPSQALLDEAITLFINGEPDHEQHFGGFRGHHARAQGRGANPSGDDLSRRTQESFDQALMPYDVVYSPEASDQLEELFLYLAKRSSPGIAER